MKRPALLLLALIAAATPRLATAGFTVEPRAVIELVPLAVEALSLQIKVSQREAAHARELARRGIAELPSCDTSRYELKIPQVGNIRFDSWGQFYIDTRFVTKSELEVVHRLEDWFARWVAAPNKLAIPQRKRAGGSGLPVFKGFEDPRYQQHDALIAKVVAEFNADKAGWCGGTASQAARIPDLSAALVKAHMIEESGGGGATSHAAWVCDPLQVNVPGDWGTEKEKVGLSRPTRRNEGTLEQNVRAAVKYLSRKGFGTSGAPAGARPAGYFDGWRDALRRYNGRRDRTETDRYYSEEYADKIVLRASSPDVFVPIERKVSAAK